MEGPERHTATSHSGSKLAVLSLDSSRLSEVVTDAHEPCKDRHLDVGASWRSRKKKVGRRSEEAGGQLRASGRA